MRLSQFEYAAFARKDFPLGSHAVWIHPAFCDPPYNHARIHVRLSSGYDPELFRTPAFNAHGAWSGPPLALLGTRVLSSPPPLLRKRSRRKAEVVGCSHSTKDSWTFALLHTDSGRQTLGSALDSARGSWPEAGTGFPSADTKPGAMPMSLYKRGGVWWAYIWIHGVRHGRSLKTGSKREAVIREREFQEELDTRRHKQIQLNPEMPFAALATRFIGSASFKPYHDNQLRSLLPYFGETPLTELNRVQADAYRSYRKNKDGVVDATVNRDLETMRRILFFAVDSGILLINPMSRVQMVRARRKRRPVLSLEEEPKLIEAATKHLKPIIIAALDTGMRRGEILSQKAEDVDLTRGVLYVTKSKTAGGEQREIPLTSRMQGLIPTLPQSGLLFTYKDEPIVKLRRSWATAVKNSGIRPLLFKQLRHTFNTRLMEAGVIQDVRMALMGHSQGTARTTNDLYTHVELPALRSAIQKLEAWRTDQAARLNKEEKQTHERSTEQTTRECPG